METLAQPVAILTLWDTSKESAVIEMTPSKSLHLPPGHICHSPCSRNACARYWLQVS
jgi:hypothetical protein